MAVLSRKVRNRAKRLGVRYSFLYMRVRDQISLDRSVIYAAVRQVADSWRNPPGSVDDVLDRLERPGLAISMAELRVSG